MEQQSLMNEVTTVSSYIQILITDLTTFLKTVQYHLELEKKLVKNGDQTPSFVAWHRGSISAYEDVLRLLTN